jgi:aminocarboxymuconate-semialdehyde decarboxylase
VGSYDLSWLVGFMFDTTLAIERMIFDGFLDRYPNLKLIAAHGGGASPTSSAGWRRATRSSCPNADG